MNKQQNPSFSTLPNSTTGARMPFVLSGGSFTMGKWKPIYINGKRTNYDVSTDGRVMSLGFDYMGNNGIRCVAYPRILKPHLNKTTGYYAVILRVNKKPTTRTIHRLVGLAHMPLVEGKTMINHKDGDKTNNHVDNLEWCNNSENIKHRIHVLGYIPNRRGKTNGKDSKPVTQLDPITGKAIAQFPSIMEAHRQTGTSPSAISSQLSGKYHTAGGFKWKFTNY